jgi:hypothetical protein
VLGRWLIAILAAVGLAAAQDGTVTRNVRFEPTSIGVLRITGSEPIPDDLSRVRYLLLDAARGGQVAALKSRYPGLKVLAYKNLSFLIDYSESPDGNAGVPWSQAPEKWFLHDGSGNRVGSVQFEDALFADVGLPAYQDAWRADVLAFLRTAPWDGVFMDDALADPGWHLGGDYGRLARYPTRASYSAAERSMLAAVGPAITGNGYLAIANVAAARDEAGVWADWASLTSGAMLEHFLEQPGDWTADTAAERSVEGAGRIFLALSYGADDDEAAQGYSRASFLLFDKPGTRSASIWSPNPGPAATLDLGAPLAPAVQDRGTWTRRFKRGTLTVDPDRGTYDAPG